MFDFILDVLLTICFCLLILVLVMVGRYFYQLGCEAQLRRERKIRKIRQEVKQEFASTFASKMCDGCYYRTMGNKYVSLLKDIEQMYCERIKSKDHKNVDI